MWLAKRIWLKLYVLRKMYQASRLRIIKHFLSYFFFLAFCIFFFSEKGYIWVINWRKTYGEDQDLQDLGPSSSIFFEDLMGLAPLIVWLKDPAAKNILSRCQQVIPLPKWGENLERREGASKTLEWPGARMFSFWPIDLETRKGIVGKVIGVTKAK